MMKKLLILLMASLLVVGCGAKGDKDEGKKDEEIVEKDDSEKTDDKTDGEKDQEETGTYTGKTGAYTFDGFEGTVHRVIMESDTGINIQYMITDPGDDFINRNISVSYPKDENFVITEEMKTDVFSDEFVTVWYAEDGAQITDIVYRGTDKAHLNSIGFMGDNTKFEQQTSLQGRLDIYAMINEKVEEITIDELKLSR